MYTVSDILSDIFLPVSRETFPYVDMLHDITFIRFDWHLSTTVVAIIRGYSEQNDS